MDALLYDEVRVVLSSVPGPELTYWYVWREGWKDWKPVGDVDGLCESLNRPMSAEKPKLPNPDFKNGPQGLVTEDVSEETNSTSSLNLDIMDLSYSQINESSGKSNFVVRKHQRHRKRYEVEVICDDKKFLTHSLDISVGGILLEDSLPSWVHGYFKIRLRKPDEKHQVELTACIVENQDPENRVRLSILPFESEDDEQKLDTWLAA